MRTICSIAVAALLLVLLGVASGEDADKKAAPEGKKADELMQRKLRESQKVLEGIAVANYDDIANHAQELIEISRAAGFRAIKTPRYEVYSREFQQNAEALVKNANDKNIDAAALSYVELTLTCVKCHKYVREQKMVQIEPDDARLSRIAP
jgi:hypothetical protein